MDYKFYLTVFSTNIITFLSYSYYMEKQNLKYQKEITNCKLIDEILNNKIDNLQKDLEKLEKFKIKILEKNIIIKENRAWDMEETSSEEDIDEDIIID